MNKKSFLNNLKTALEEAGISAENIQMHITYYNDYIDERVKAGNMEENTVESLGEPRLIAKTIIEIENNKETKTNERYERPKQENRKKGFHMNYTDQGYDVRYGRFKLNSWYGKLFGVILLILFIILLISIFTGIISLLVALAGPIMVVILLVLFIKALQR